MQKPRLSPATTINKQRRNTFHLSCLQRVNWNPNRNELRKFALAMIIGFTLLGLMVTWLTGEFGNKTFTLWGLGVALAVAAFIPRLGRGAYLAVYIPASIIGHYLSYVVLVIIFLGIIVPIALVLRLMKKDLLRLKPKGKRALWLEINKATETETYYRPF